MKLSRYAALLLLPLCSCISTLEVTYEEVQPDGSYILTKVKERVPPGGKKLSEGSTRAAVAPDGSWDLTVNGAAETDGEGTAAFYENLGAIAFNAIAAYLAAQAAAPAVGAIGGQ